MVVCDGAVVLSQCQHSQRHSFGSLQYCHRLLHWYVMLRKEFWVIDSVRKQDIRMQANIQQQHMVDHTHVGPKRGRAELNCSSFG